MLLSQQNDLQSKQKLTCNMVSIMFQCQCLNCHYQFVINANYSCWCQWLGKLRVGCGYLVFTVLSDEHFAVIVIIGDLAVNLPVWKQQPEEYVCGHGSLTKPQGAVLHVKPRRTFWWTHTWAQKHQIWSRMKINIELISNWLFYD